jgi:small conductance mechanosensitive channel
MMEVATALAISPKWRSRILEKPEIWGLESISAEAIVIRLVLKTRTTAKDDVSRELRKRLKEALDEMGVKLPSLTAIVLSGFDGAASVTGAKPPRTRPTPAVEELPKGRRARAAAKRSGAVVVDPRSVTLKTKAQPSPTTPSGPKTQPAPKTPPQPDEKPSATKPPEE